MAIVATVGKTLFHSHICCKTSKYLLSFFGTFIAKKRNSQVNNSCNSI